MDTVQNINTSTTRRAWSRKLTFYHPSSTGNGSAVEIEVAPAMRDRDGQVFISIAPQNPTPENVVVTASGKPCAAFFWKNRICIKLSFQEVAEMIMVLSGRTKTIVHGGKEGLFHASSEANTTVSFKQAEDSNHQGSIFFSVSRTLKSDPDSRQSLCFNFSQAEVLGLRLALEQSMAVLAFGIPRSCDFKKEYTTQEDFESVTV